MIKVLQIMDNISIKSGVSSIVMNIYRNINRDRVQFDFLVSNKVDNSYENEIKKYGGNIFYSGNPLSPKTLVRTCINNKIFLMENKDNYKAVHLHSPTIADMTIRYAKKIGIKNIIVHSHSTSFSTNSLKMIINSFLKRNLLNYANIYFACSTEAAYFLYGKEFFEEKEIKIIKNGVEPEKYRFNSHYKKNILNEWRWNDYMVVCHTSNFSALKNIEFLIPVIENLTKYRKDIRFLFLGDGPTRENFEKKLINRNLQEYCKFIGFTDKVNYYLNAADLFVLPSIKEGLPVAVVEAQANGIPCIISESITKEVKVGDVEFVPLNQNNWIHKINSFKSLSDEERKNKSYKFRNSEFNIIKQSKILEDFYLKLND